MTVKPSAEISLPTALSLITTAPNSDYAADITNNTMATVSEEERRRYLDQLQAETNITMVPTLTFLALLGITGLVGNSLVIFVYSRRRSQTSTKVLIMAMAGFDLWANIVLIPTNIYHLLHIWDFNSPYLCRLRVFNNAFTTLNSAMILVAVAVVRYRKVCTPFDWQVTLRHTKYICVVVSLLGILFSIPHALIYGHQLLKTPRPSIYGDTCSVDAKYVNTCWPLLVVGFFLFLFLACWTPVIVLNTQIGIKAWRSSKTFRISNISLMTTKKTNDRPTFCDKIRNKIVLDVSKSSVGRVESNRNAKPKDGHELGKDCGGCIEDVKCEFSPSNIVEVIQQTVGNVDDKVGIKTSVTCEWIEGVEGAADVVGAADDNADLQDIVASEMKEETVKDVDRCSADMVTHYLKSDAFENGARTPNDREGKGKDLSEPVHTTSSGSLPVSPFRHKNTCHIYYATSQDNQEVTKARQDSPMPNFPVKDRDQTPCEANPFSTLQQFDNVDTPLKVPNIYDVSKTSAVKIIQRADTSLFASDDNSKKAECQKTVSFHTLAEEKATSVPQRTTADADGHQNIQMAKQESVDEKVNIQTFCGIINMDDPQETKTRGGTRGESDPKEINQNDSIKEPNQLVAQGNPGKSTISREGGMRQKPASRTTVMLIVASAVFIIGFLPFLVVTFFERLAPEKFQAFSRVELSLFYLFERFYLLNSAANPIIYNLCNNNFRQECLSLLKYHLCRRC